MFLPCKGRWQAEGLTEGCRPLDSGTPLRRAARATSPCRGGLRWGWARSESGMREANAPPLQGRGRGWGASTGEQFAAMPHPNPSPEGEGLALTRRNVITL